MRRYKVKSPNDFKPHPNGPWVRAAELKYELNGLQQENNTLKGKILVLERRIKKLLMQKANKEICDVTDLVVI